MFELLIEVVAVTDVFTSLRLSNLNSSREGGLSTWYPCQRVHSVAPEEKNSCQHLAAALRTGKLFGILSVLGRGRFSLTFCVFGHRELVLECISHLGL